MNYDAGDFFVVTKGEPITQVNVSQGWGQQMQASVTEGELFDPRYKDAIFVVLAADENFIAAEVVWDPIPNNRQIPIKKVLINLSKVEVCSIPKNVAMALCRRETTVQSVKVLPENVGGSVTFGAPGMAIPDDFIQKFFPGHLKKEETTDDDDDDADDDDDGQ